MPPPWYPDLALRGALRTTCGRAVRVNRGSSHGPAAPSVPACAPGQQCNTYMGYRCAPFDWDPAWSRCVRNAADAGSDASTNDASDGAAASDAAAGDAAGD